jgi:hypothetical protein
MKWMGGSVAIRKYAAVDAKLYRPELVTPVQSLSKFGSFAFKPRPGYIYPRVRAISARINKNFDGFPSEELQKAAHTFNGRPVFVNHNNQDPKRTRGVILASQYHGLSEDPHITILPEVDALTFPMLAQDIIKGNMDSVSMGCDVDNSTCSYCGNVATTADEFCDHILNNKGQELTKLVNGQPKRILVFEICRGLNFFEISFVFDPADETAVMQDLLVPDGVKMSSAGINIPPLNTISSASGGTTTILVNTGQMTRTASSAHVAYGEMIAPPKVDTLRDDDQCPQCGSDFNGVECDNCGYITPPEELQDPDTEKAGGVRDGDEDDSEGQNGDLDYFGEGGDDSDDEDEDDTDEDEDDDDEPNPYDLYRGQPRKEGNVSRGTAVQANVGQALAQRRLREAQARLRSLGDNNDIQGGEEQIASQPSGSDAPAGGSDEAVAAPDFSTTVENLDQEEPAGDWGQREQVQSSTRHRANGGDLTNNGVAEPTDETKVTTPVSNQTDDRAEQDQYAEGEWDGNADNQPQGGGDSSGTSTVVPDGRGSAPMQAGASTKQAAVVLKKASASQVYQLADLYTELGLVPHEHRYAAIAEIEKMPAMVAEHTIKVLGRVKEVFATNTAPAGRVARTAGTIPALGKTASARTPSMARQAETRRLASSAEDTLLLF